MLVYLLQTFDFNNRRWFAGQNPDVPVDIARQWISEGKASTDTTPGAQTGAGGIPTEMASRLAVGSIPLPAPVMRGSEGALVVVPSGRRLDVKTIARTGLPIGAATSSIWFPLSERQNSTQNDYAGTLQGSCKGGSTGRWGMNPGMQFNGSNHRIECNTSLANAPQFSSCVAPAQQGFTAAVRECANLASLVSKGDMIICWAVLSHGSGSFPADGVILSFGMNADPTGKGGWAVGIKSGAAAKPLFMHRAVGASARLDTVMSTDGITGKNNDNTRSAVCFQIYASYVTNLIQVDGYMLTLGTDGSVSQNNCGTITPSLLGTGGTAACGADQSCPLTIGAMPDSIPYANLAPSGTIATGASGHLTLSADFGAPGSGGTTLPFTQGVWLWFGAVATTPALTAKLYWCVFSTLRIATIYSNGPGSAALNFSVGAAYSSPTSNYVNYFTGAIGNVGIQRRPKDYGLGMRVVRDLRNNMAAFPASLG